ncbi:MAG: CHASE3 domain-containing protein [Pirellulales bacterium]
MSWSIGKLPTIGFLLAIAVLITSTALSYYNFKQVADNEAQVVHTHEVLDALAQTLASVTDAETGQRGYVITGDKAYLEPYHAANKRLLELTARLSFLTGDNEDQQAELTKLQALVAGRVGVLEKVIAARDLGGLDAARGLVLTGEGKRQMDAIRAQVAAMQEREQELLDIRSLAARVSYATARATLLLTGGLGLGLVVISYALALREVQTRQRSVQALALANNQLEERVRERTATLNGVNDSLRRSNSELEQFASVASHDLQEPLRKIQAFGDRLQSKYAEPLGEQGRDYIERMQGSAARMRSLIDALLNYSRVTTKAQPFLETDLNQIAREVVSDLEGRLQESGGRVELGTLPACEADPLQMRQLLQNLISNGLKFHPPGVPPVVRVEGRLAPSANGGAAQCELVVRDNGIGFDEVYRERIFDVFQRLHGRQEYEGTGMGLAICRKIVDRHRGTITAASAPGRGATFTVTIPQRQAKDDAA